MFKNIVAFLLFALSLPGYASSYFLKKDMDEHHYKIFNACMDRCCLDEKTQDEMREWYRKSSDTDNKYYYVGKGDGVDDNEFILHSLKVFLVFWGLVSIVLVFFLGINIF